MGGLSLTGLWLFLAAVLSTSVYLAVASVGVANKTSYRPDAEQPTGSLSPFLTTVALVYGALLGFTVVVAWEQFSSAEANVTNESSTLATMYRQTVSLPAPEQAPMRDLLRDYTAAVKAEWGSRGNGAPSAAARTAITDMYRMLGQQQPASANPINAEMRQQLNVLTAQRNTRILDAKPRIPGLLWSGLLFGGVLLIALIGFTKLSNPLNHMLLSSAIAILLGLLLFLIFSLDHPFGRELGVTPASFDYVVQVFDGVDAGT
ncbi:MULTISPECIES: bestrophin-like domain [unclassified Mycolicibacterium]|uniref:bestrophin-like domain n=1 Tax=unclassified Mycolicibacterium TaxID=2636767 RepID=UPI002ED7A520